MLKSPKDRQDSPELAAPKPSASSTLTPESTVGDLWLYSLALATSQATRDAIEAFAARPLLPGIILLDGGRYAGMISRRRFLQKMSERYSLELFPERPLALIYQFLQVESLVLYEDTGISTAVEAALGREPAYRYEPVVVQRGEAYALLDIHTLLMAQSRLHQMTAALLNQRTQDYLVQTEKMATLGRMVAGISHEIKNPVNCIYGNVGFIRQYSDGLLHLIGQYQQSAATRSQGITEAEAALDLEFVRQDLPAVLDSMATSSERLFDIVSSLRNFSRFDSEAKQRVDIHKLLDGTLLILNSRISQRVNVIKRYGELPPLPCYPGQMGQVFMNIIANALEALEDRLKRERPDHGESAWEPILSLTTVILPEAPNQVIIRISDSGGGIPDDVQQKIFSEFFTTKPLDKGTGLGLAISHRIIENHGGTITLRSQVGVGTEFDIMLPLS